MCEAEGDPAAVAAVTPRAAAGEAVDPIGLEPVDSVEITTLVDNSFDALLTDSNERMHRKSFAAGSAVAPQFEGGSTHVGLVAEHGFGALVTVRRGDRSTTLLFDTGLSPTALVTNAERLGISLGDIHSVVLSHGHFDHAGGLAGLAGKRGTRSLPMVVHPLIWTRRRLALPGREPDELPTLSRSALSSEGYEVIERRVPSLLLDGCVLLTGEVDRTTEFERGMPPAHEAWNGTEWAHDPTVIDDQALVVHLRGQGLVVLTGCGHAGAVNIVRHAQRLTAVPQLHALLGGFHLGGPWFEPVIRPTVDALVDLAPSLIVPGHCTGWKAQHTLAGALPDAWVPSSVGTTYTLRAA